MHPGKFLKEEYLDHISMTATGLADTVGVSQATISRLLNGKSSITPEMAIKLQKVFGVPANYWLSLQASYDLASLGHK